MFEFLKELFKAEKENMPKPVRQVKPVSKPEPIKNVERLNYSERWENNFNKVLNDFYSGKENLLPTIYCYLTS